MTFDDTGISAFDLKREDILVTRANDFNLYVFDATTLSTPVNSYLSRNMTWKMSAIVSFLIFILIRFI